MIKRVADAYDKARIDTVRVLEAYKKKATGVDPDAVIGAYRETMAATKPRENSSEF